MVEGGSAMLFDGHEIPRAWRVGDFELEVAELTRGRLDRETGLLRGVAGKAWLHLPCAQPPIHPGIHAHPEARALTHSLQVVTEVLHPQTEISLADAQRLRPGVALGDTVPLPFAVDRADPPGDRVARPRCARLARLGPARRRLRRRVQRAHHQPRRRTGHRRFGQLHRSPARTAARSRSSSTGSCSSSPRSSCRPTGRLRPRR